MVKKFSEDDCLCLSRLCLLVTLFTLFVAVSTKVDNTVYEESSFCATGRGRCGTGPERQVSKYGPADKRGCAGACGPSTLGGRP